MTQTFTVFFDLYRKVCGIFDLILTYLGIEKKSLNFKMPYEHYRMKWVQKTYNVDYKNQAHFFVFTSGK